MLQGADSQTAARIGMKDMVAVIVARLTPFFRSLASSSRRYLDTLSPNMVSYAYSLTARMLLMI